MEAVKLKFEELIHHSEKPVLVDFYANWCGPCHAMAPTLKEIAAEFAEKIKVVKVDVEKNPAVSSLYKIISIPTLILFHRGEIKWRESGVVPLHSLKKILTNIK